MRTPRDTGALAAAMLAGAFALGACGGQETATEGVVQEQVQSADARAAAAQQSAASTAQRLRQVRTLHPTAGLEVPPADLLRTATPVEKGGDGPPRGTRVDGADIGWPTRAAQ